MIVAPAAPNSIHVVMVRTGCLKTQFNSAYPARLNGIINHNEFQESIKNINNKISDNKSQIVCIAFFFVFIIGGMALVIVASVSQYARGSLSVILIPVGAMLIGLAPLVRTIRCCIIRTRRTTKIREAIAEESKKYSTRSPVACSWRLTITRIWSRGYGHHHRVLRLYRVVIDIRQPTTSGGNARSHPNQVRARLVSAVPPYDEIPPPLYPGHSAAFCSQCGVPRPDPVAKFCSSCGHPFDKY